MITNAAGGIKGLTHGSAWKNRYPCRMALDLVDELAALVDAFEAERVPYAVCGGIALAVHGHPRATKDIDVLVPAGEVERAVAVAKTVGFDVPGPRLKFGLATASVREVQRHSKIDPSTGELLMLDLLVVNAELEQVWSERVLAEWRGHTLCLVSRSGLATMKRLAGRAQDIADIAKLEGTDDDENR
jgi:hypothetical protein